MASSIGRWHPRRVTEAAAVPTGTSWHSAAQQSFNVVLSFGEPFKGEQGQPLFPPLARRHRRPKASNLALLLLRR